jgi:hypothetical protein
MVGWADKEKNRNVLIFEFKYILEFGKTLRISKGDLEAIWTQGFFLNSSRLPNDFRKNIICHAMNATLSPIKLRKSCS